MEQNRFSRQLIVLRAVINGYSGHARLVHNADDTDLELRLQTPDAECALYAAWVSRGDTGYVAQVLGALNVDGRGQADGTFSLQSIADVPDILAIVQQDGSGCKLAMSGFLNGPRSVNWSDVRAAACDAVTGSSSVGTDLADGPDTAETMPAEDAQKDMPSVSAAKAAGVSADAVWPVEISALQPVFESQAPVAALSGSRYTFVRVPAAGEQPEYYAGLWCVQGIPVRAAYAVPAADPDTQPQGLESFVWRSGPHCGYWVAYVDAATGLPVADDC